MPGLFFFYDAYYFHAFLRRGTNLQMKRPGPEWLRDTGVKVSSGQGLTGWPPWCERHMDTLIHLGAHRGTILQSNRPAYLLCTYLWGSRPLFMPGDSPNRPLLVCDRREQLHDTEQGEGWAASSDRAPRGEDICMLSMGTRPHDWSGKHKYRLHPGLDTYQHSLQPLQCPRELTTSPFGRLTLRLKEWNISLREF